VTYPDMKRRYISSTIDVLVVLGTAMIIAGVLQSESPGVVAARVVLIGFIVVNYEPVLISRSQTLGQRLMGIRVRRRSEPSERIGLPQAYLRTLLKFLVGTLSFFTMGFNKERRALHDLATGSIVLDNRNPESAPNL
jgi:uncharacterized RDD family membrane protein YckC